MPKSDFVAGLIQDSKTWYAAVQVTANPIGLSVPQGNLSIIVYSEELLAAEGKGVITDSL